MSYRNGQRVWRIASSGYVMARRLKRWHGVAGSVKSVGNIGTSKECSYIIESQTEGVYLGVFGTVLESDKKNCSCGESSKTAQIS